MAIDDYLDRLRDNFVRMDDEELAAVLVEIRDYLDQESERLRNLSPGMEKDDALRQAMAEFGAPSDIAFVYDARWESLSVVNQSTGERLLDIPEVGGPLAGRTLSTKARGLRVMIKYRGLTALAVVALAAALLAAGGFFGVQDDGLDVDGDVIELLYLYDAVWTVPDDSGVVGLTETFDAGHGDAFALNLDIQSESGCVQIAVIDPSGASAFDSGDLCDGASIDQQITLSGTGTWTVQYDYRDFAGSVHVDAQAAQ